MLSRSSNALGPFAGIPEPEPAPERDGESTAAETAGFDGLADFAEPDPDPDPKPEPEEEEAALGGVAELEADSDPELEAVEAAGGGRGGGSKEGGGEDALGAAVAPSGLVFPPSAAALVMKS